MEVKERNIQYVVGELKKKIAAAKAGAKAGKLIDDSGLDTLRGQLYVLFQLDIITEEEWTELGDAVYFAYLGEMP